MLHVKPAQGRVVRDPITRDVLPETGAVVPSSSYWLRRLADGSVLEVPPIEAAKNLPTPLAAEAQVPLSAARRARRAKEG